MHHYWHSPINMEGLREPENYGLFHPFRLVGWRSQRAGRKLFYLQDHATAQAPCDYLLVLKPSLEYPGAHVNTVDQQRFYDTCLPHHHGVSKDIRYIGRHPNNELTSFSSSRLPSMNVTYSKLHSVTQPHPDNPTSRLRSDLQRRDQPIPPPRFHNRHSQF